MDGLVIFPPPSCALLELWQGAMPNSWSGSRDPPLLGITAWGQRLACPAV
jgi:hypothetical protein